MVRKPRLALIGAGHMGLALAKSWIKHGLIAKQGWLVIVDPTPSEAAQKLAEQLKSTIVPALESEQASLLETLVLAVKPKLIPEVGQTLARILPETTLIISVAAGVTLNRLGEVFGTRPLVRAMPNMPASIGRGATVFVSGPGADKNARNQAQVLLSASGMAEEVDEEKALDAVTAVSGSGPAYVFLLAEALAVAGVAEGLDPELARKLACETVAGAGELLRQRDCDPAVLRAEVTSPGGTTAAAMDVLMGSGGFAEMMRRAVNSAARRSGQLGSQS
ncbi:MAG: pyrroline-5-carboxylate reductase [Robiginitomaculum sp.]|nr:pyrroline-5-carboxylate reductase [Robiginitomaculum sp.]MDQ7077123.1 pyrroline-5-carboxylate reductase [Robiginitomaculum sp.]